jgi:hypothetical protein
MCLIAYVPAGKQLPEENFRSAAHDNNDGIGVMSANDGVEKFVGRKQNKRAWRYVRELQSRNAEFAIHFRYATHGYKSLANTHPFRVSDGSAYIMHNGILTQYTPRDTNGLISDTRIFVDTLNNVDVTDADYWNQMGAHIGSYNKLCVMSYDGQFRIVNEDSGDWIAGIWYSQTYSLPGYGWQTTGNSNIGAVQHGGVSYIWDPVKGKLIEVYRGSNAAYGGYGRIVDAALERKYGSQTHDKYCFTCKEYYERTCACDIPNDRDDERLDKELAAHFADMEQCAQCEFVPIGGQCPDCGYIQTEPTDICPSCEHIHSEGKQCPECGFIDMSDGMLDGYQTEMR